MKLSNNNNIYVGAITDKVLKIDLYLTHEKEETIGYKRGQHLKISGDIEKKGIIIIKLFFLYLI